jgi:hypothetical protein
MTDILDLCREALNGSGFSTRHVDTKSTTPAIIFESDTVLGFAVAYEQFHSLIRDWRTDVDGLFSTHSFGLRRAGDKAWNAYAVILCRQSVNGNDAVALGAIDEDLVGFRKVTYAGIPAFGWERCALGWRRRSSSRTLAAERQHVKMKVECLKMEELLLTVIILEALRCFPKRPAPSRPRIAGDNSEQVFLCNFGILLGEGARLNEVPARLFGIKRRRAFGRMRMLRNEPDRRRITSPRFNAAPEGSGISVAVSWFQLPDRTQ